MASASASAAFALLGACSTAHAYNWALNQSGNFNDGTKWTGGVAPNTTSDTAQFFVNANATYTVTFTNSPNIGATIVTTNNNVTFVTNGSPQTLTTSGVTVGSAGAVLTLGSAAAPLLINAGQVVVNTSGKLNVNAGNDIATTGTVKIADLGSGTIAVDGAGSSFSAGGLTTIVQANQTNGGITFSNGSSGSFAALGIGSGINSGSNASLNVQSDADVTASGMINLGTGGATAQTGSLTVTGSGSSFTQSGTNGLFIGANSNSTGTLAITSGGTFTTGNSGATINPTGRIILDAGTFNGNGTLMVNGAVNISNGSTFTMGDNKSLSIGSAGTMTITGSTVRTGFPTSIAGLMTFNSGSLSLGFAPNITGKLDLKNNLMVVRDGPVGTVSGSLYDGVTGLIQRGRNGDAGPLWDGNGIITTQSTAVNSNFHSIGVARASEVRPIGTTDTALWSGHTVTGFDCLVMYTYGGDANLDGKINIDDYVKIDLGSKAGIAGWSNGDFNYDGKINIDDYVLIDENIFNQTTVFPTGTGIDPTSITAVPEPAGALVLALGLGVGMPLRGRKRRY